MRAGLLFILTFTTLLAYGQTGNLTIQYNHTSLTDAIRDIESKSGYRFYYADAWVDSLYVSVFLRDASIQTVLDTLLANSGLHSYIIDGKIILTQGIYILDKVDTVTFARYEDPDSTSQTFKFQRELVSNDQNEQKQNTVIEIGVRGQAKSVLVTLAGYIKERTTGESIPGAVVYVKGTKYATTSDRYGFYSLSLPSGAQSVSVGFTGMEDVLQRVMIYSGGTLNLMLDQKITVLNEVTVVSDQDQHVLNNQMGLNKIEIASMKNVPKILGENDVFKIAMTLPGIKTVGEGSSGINVRGGNADQNLVMLNEATIYNPVHFLGFFSVFNADAIKSFELYKSTIPARLGGRLSSVFDIQMKDGNQKKFSGQGGIGPITSHLTFDVPLKKDKTSLTFGGRTTYSNWVLKQIPDQKISKSNASFYDAFVRLTHTINSKNYVYGSFYYSKDKYNLSSDSLFSYKNALGSLQWRHLFNNNHTGVLTLSQSSYKYTMGYSTIPEYSFDLGFGIKETHAKWNFNYTRNKHQIEYGVDEKLYELNPGYRHRPTDESLVTEKQIGKEKGLESALYLSDDIDLSPAFSVSFGLRYSLFTALGPGTSYRYDPNLPKGNGSITDSLVYSNNKVIKKYQGPEYRISARYKLTDNSSVKAGYNRTRQYIHMLSNTVSVSPTNTWALSDANLLPQVGDQISLGFYEDLKNKIYELSVEGYYKWLQNVIDYKTGSSLILNDHIEQDVLQGRGKAYGIEVLLKKKTGKLTGWIGYTYSRTFIQLNGNYPEEKVNGGKYFPASYDKPHDISVVTNYKITRRYSLAMNFVYNTGRPITYPTGIYKYDNTYRINYSDRNAFRVPDYIRLDIGLNIEGSHKVKKLAHSFWTISVYNLLGRKNPYSIYFKVENDKIKAYKLSIFGAPIPTITYNFKF